MRAVIKAMAVAANFEKLHEETRLLQELYERHPELFARMRLGDQIDAAMAKEVARRIGADPTRTSIRISWSVPRSPPCRPRNSGRVRPTRTSRR